MAWPGFRVWSNGSCSKKKWTTGSIDFVKEKPNKSTKTNNNNGLEKQDTQLVLILFTMTWTSKGLDGKHYEENYEKQCWGFFLIGRHIPGTRITNQLVELPLGPITEKCRKWHIKKMWKIFSTGKKKIFYEKISLQLSFSKRKPYPSQKGFLKL